METKKENNETASSSHASAANIPEWVMHLLTGLGTMGAEYMMFIKPLQEKMELQSKLIKEQGDRIAYLEELLQSGGKGKHILAGSEEDEDQDLFQIKRKPTGLQKYGKHNRIKL